MSNSAREIWSRRIFDRLVEEGVELFGYVPDAGNKAIIEMAEESNATRPVLLTSEEEGIAVCAGADLVGKRAVVCMQSSGVGNCPNFLALIEGAKFPLLMIVTMRGDYGEQNPWQYPMGQAVEPILKAMGVRCLRVDTVTDLDDALEAAIGAAFKAGQAVALILSQRFLGAKPFGGGAN
jgi:sulfopyruvate decarboxylase alpha subunit